MKTNNTQGFVKAQYMSKVIENGNIVDSRNANIYHDLSKPYMEIETQFNDDVKYEKINILDLLENQNREKSNRTILERLENDFGKKTRSKSKSKSRSKSRSKSKSRTSSKTSKGKKTRKNKSKK
jgi:hypothetical protein